MSTGGSQMCITMGTAESIAITMIVTANSFPIVSSFAFAVLAANSANLIAAKATTYQAPPLLGYLLGLEGEVSGRWLSRGHSDFLRLRSVVFLPCGDGVIARRQSFDSVGTASRRSPRMVLSPRR